MLSLASELDMTCVMRSKPVLYVNLVTHWISFHVALCTITTVYLTWVVEISTHRPIVCIQPCTVNKLTSRDAFYVEVSDLLDCVNG